MRVRERTFLEASKQARSVLLAGRKVEQFRRAHVHRHLAADTVLPLLLSASRTVYFSRYPGGIPGGVCKFRRLCVVQSLFYFTVYLQLVPVVHLQQLLELRRRCSLVLSARPMLPCLRHAASVELQSRQVRLSPGAKRSSQGTVSYRGLFRLSGQLSGTSGAGVLQRPEPCQPGCQ